MGADKQQQACFTGSQWGALSRLRATIVGDFKLQDEFEARPRAVIGSLGDIPLTGTLFGNRKIAEVLDQTPAGIRLVILDYILSSVENMRASDDDPEIEPKGVLAVVNLAAVFNLAALQNLAVYHQVGAVLWVGAAAAISKVAKFKGSGSFPDLDDDLNTVRHSIAFIKRYLNGTWHKFLQKRGYGPSREKMAVRRLLSQAEEPVPEGSRLRCESPYRDKKIRILVEFSDNSSALMVPEAEVF